MASPSFVSQAIRRLWMLVGSTGLVDNTCKNRDFMIAEDDYGFAMHPSECCREESRAFQSIELDESSSPVC
jgi:hypothetical protein